MADFEQMVNMVKEAQAEKKMLSEKIANKKCDCEKQSQQRMNIRESEKKATDEKIQSLLSKTQKLDSKLRDS